MPAVTSDTAIANLALQKLGESPILDINDDASMKARALKLVFAVCRQSLLREHAFSFSVKRVEIIRVLGDPLNGWAGAYQLPDDYIRALSLNEDDSSTHRDNFVIEGRNLLTDLEVADDAFLKYVADITDATAYDALFVEALAYKLAMETCANITGSDAKMEAMTKAFIALALPSAEAANSREDRDRQPWYYRASRLVVSRRTSSLG